MAEKPRFIRVNGRIVPIGAKKGAKTGRKSSRKPKKKDGGRDVGVSERLDKGFAAGAELGLIAGQFKGLSNSINNQLAIQRAGGSITARTVIQPIAKGAAKGALIGGLSLAAINAAFGYRRTGKNQPKEAKGGLGTLAAIGGVGMAIHNRKALAKSGVKIAKKGYDFGKRKIKYKTKVKSKSGNVIDVKFGKKRK